MFPIYIWKRLVTSYYWNYHSGQEPNLFLNTSFCFHDKSVLQVANEKARTAILRKVKMLKGSNVWIDQDYPHNSPGREENVDQANEGNEEK